MYLKSLIHNFLFEKKFKAWISYEMDATVLSPNRKLHVGAGPGFPREEHQP